MQWSRSSSPEPPLLAYSGGCSCCTTIDTVGLMPVVDARQTAWSVAQLRALLMAQMLSIQCAEQVCVCWLFVVC